MSAIRVDDVSKMYKIYNKNSDRVLEAIFPTKKTLYRPFYALRNISFSVEEGETVGIIGTNGSGKSTILKIITGVLKPTEGNIDVKGRVSALLELGAGFDEEYTGIENIYMNGSILGYSKEEMDKKKAEILDFADIGDFAMQPVKTYSSGMLVRLAFALAINVEPEILIIDEALAVGDAFFQAKCYHKLDEIKNKGTTILFVSHDISSVKKLCSRVVWMDNGRLREVGEANEVCEKYMSAQIERMNQENEKILSVLDLQDDECTVIEKAEGTIFPKISLEKAEAISGTGKAKILSFYIQDEQGNNVRVVKANEKYRFGIVAEFMEELQHVALGFELENLRGVRVITMNNYMADKSITIAKAGQIYEVAFTLVLPKICKGEYLLTIAVANGNQENHIVQQRLHNFETIFVDNNGKNLALIELDADTQIISHKKENVVIK